MSKGVKYLNINYDVKIEGLPIKDIAEKYDVSRNTVRNICNRCKLSNSKLKKLKEDFDEGRIQEYKIDSLLIKTRQCKVTEKHKKDIEMCCKKYMLCYKTVDELCDYFCNVHKVRKKYIVGYIGDYCNDFYYIDNFGREEKVMGYNNDRMKYTRGIRNVRKQTQPPKRYEYIYEKYKDTDSYRKTPISQECFYQYAREHWIDDFEWKGMTFGVYLDKYFEYDEENDKIKRKTSR